LILLIAICAMHNADSIKINRLIFQLRKSYCFFIKNSCIFISADIYGFIGECFPAGTQKRMLARKKTVEQLVRFL